MLRAFYDASGTFNESPVLTLAVMIASESVWEQFDNDWQRILAKHEISELHMSDAMSLRGSFSETYGWNHSRVDSLVAEFWRCIGSFRAFDKSPSNLSALSCSVIKEDYRKAKIENPKLREAEAICVQVCISGLPVDIDSRRDKPPEVILMFDSNEQFLHKINRNWIKYRNKMGAGWPKQIKSILPASSSEFCGLQAADLLAWTMNKYHREPERSRWAPICALLIEHRSKTYDFSSIVEDFPNGY